MAETFLIPSERIVSKIYIIRNRKIMLDRDLAELYGVPTKSLNLAVKRNIKRFPEDFMFQLTKESTQNIYPVSLQNKGLRCFPVSLQVIGQLK